MRGLDDKREAAEASLLEFIHLMAPNRVLGSVHEELITWWTRSDAKGHQLVLLPRDHQKSTLLAFKTAWEITREPDTTILYISATSNLAIKQLGLIKQILASTIYTKYWPEMIHPDEGKRLLWNATEISVDHPLRQEEMIRDPTVRAAGLNTNVTGMHFRKVKLDDLVVQENAYTKEMREKVKTLYSLLSSVGTSETGEEGDISEDVVGTRYHPQDLYNDLIEMEYDVFDKEGNVLATEPIFEVFERQVEDQGDGTGQFLWPRQKRHDGRWFGFNAEILSKKRAKYLDRAQFRSQYYNNPNDPENENISSSKFQYYERNLLTQRAGRWFYKDQPLNVFAAIDFAFSQLKLADHTAIVVVGVDPKNNTFVLDIDRFKSTKISEYYDHLIKLHLKWNFRKLRAETNVAQESIVRELKQQYLQRNGIMLSIDEKKPNRMQGTKEERIAAVLEPRYANLSMWHYRGGNCQLLEDELKAARPPHDDIKDALAAACEISSPAYALYTEEPEDYQGLQFNSRFGGVHR